MKKLLSVTAAVVALALAVAPVSFAGEDNPGPTQSGEVVGTQPAPAPAPAPAPQPAPAAPRSAPAPKAAKPRATSHGRALAQTHSSSRAKAKKVVRKSRDTVRAKGGVQTGLGGAVAAESNLTLGLGMGLGGLVLLTAAGSVAPIRRSTKG